MTSRGGAIGVFTTDRVLVVRSWDAWMAEASGIAEGDASGHSLVALFPDLEPRGLAARLRRVVESGVVEVLAPAFHEYLIACAPRAATPHFARMQQHVTIKPLLAGGAIAGLAVMIEDVTARRARELELGLQLKSADDGVRLQAVRTIAAEEHQRTGALVGALGDRSWRVRRAAAEGLAHGSDDTARDALLAALRERHREPAVLNAALTALVETHHDVTPSLIELLGDGNDAEVRTYAALALGLLADRRAVPALVRALGDADSNARFHAIEALGRIRSRAAALPVALIAESRDFSVAFAALDTLAAIGEPSMAPRLVPLLEHKLLQTAAADALGRIGGEDAVASLAAMLERHPMAAASAAGALATLSERLDGGRPNGSVAGLARGVVSPRAAEHLEHALLTATDTEARGIVVVLGWLDADGVERALARALAHPDTRPAAADALGRRGTRAVEPLLAALAGDDDDLRRSAVAALGKIGTPAAVPALVALLADAPQLAVAVCNALGSIGDPRAFEPLLAQLDDPHAAVRQAAVAALHSIGHPDTPERVCALLGDPSPRVREGAARIGGYLGHPACLEPLLSACDDEDEVVRRTVVEQLPHFDDPRALHRISAALDAGTSGVRAAAARALAHVAAHDAMPRLLAACADADPWVRYYAARSLGHLGEAGAVRVLVRLATSDDVPPVRIAAVDALAELRSRDGLASLQPLADDPDPAVARQVLLALGQSDDPGAVTAVVHALRSGARPAQTAALDALALLARRADSSVVAAVVPLSLDGVDAEVRSKAVAVLAGIGGEDAVAVLLAVAEDPRHTARIVDALAQLGEDQVQWVGAGLSHRDVAVRCATIEALGRMGHPSVSPLVAAALEDAEEGVRLAAAHALGRLDVRGATE